VPSVRPRPVSFPVSYTYKLASRAEVCGLRTRPLADADPQELSDPRTESGRMFLRTLRTRTDADHNCSTYKKAMLSQGNRAMPL